jgi:glyoxylase-like metal-dependent hydrolase (beta-lactamase superfamily II)
MSDDLEEQTFDAVTVWYGAKRGKYPHGNSLTVRGASETVVIDPSLGLVVRGDAAPRADRVLHSHCHEDHIAGSFLYPDAPWHFHTADLRGIRSLDGLMEVYGYPEPVHSIWRKTVVSQFHFTPRADAIGFRDGDVFELGGGVRVRVIHAPGHTRGHCLFHVEPDDLVYLADIDLSSFGPYYGDAWSELDDFERTLEAVRKIDARYYATFHHIGVVEGRDAYLERLGRFIAVIGDREQRLLTYLAEPHSIAEIAEHRFVYRPQDPVPFAEPVERRSMSQHVSQLLRAGRVREVEPGRFQRRDA